MEAVEPVKSLFRWPDFLRAVFIALLAVMFAFSGVFVIYSEADLALRGVPGEAVVLKYLGKERTQRRGISWENHEHLLEFDGRTLQRLSSQRYDVGQTLPIRYIPNSNNMEIESERSSIFTLLLLVGVIEASALLIGYIGFGSIGDQLGWWPPPSVVVPPENESPPREPVGD